MTEIYHSIMAEADLADGIIVPLVLNGWPVALCRLGGDIHAVINKCTHAEAELSGGRLRRGTITCPLHGARFELSSGKCIGAPYAALKVFPVRVSDGIIEIAVPDEPPGANHAPVHTGL